MEQNNRIGVEKCQVCDLNLSKYKCPGCHILFCSSKCGQTHKSRTDCRGVREKSKFVSADKFSNLDLYSDLNFLDSIGRQTGELSTPDIKESRFPYKKVDRLIRIARGRNCRRQCRLLHLPENFEKRRQNTTFFDDSRHLIIWKVALKFPQIDKIVTLDGIPETKRIYEILDPYLSGRDPEFDIYSAEGYGNLKVLLKVEHLPEFSGGQTQNLPDSLKYWELDVKKSVLANLRKKTVVEYPTFYIIFASHAKGLNIMEEEDAEFEAKKAQEASEDLEAAESDEAVGVTFGLFAQESSDSDTETLEKKRKSSESVDPEGVLPKPESKRAKYWKSQAKELEDSSFMRAYAFQHEDQPARSSENESESESNEDQYKAYYDFYLKYYQGKYGVKDQEPKEKQGEVEKQEGVQNPEPEKQQSGCLVAYDDSDTDE